MRKNPTELLCVQNLSLAVFLSDDMTPEMADWKEAEEIPMAESCARQVWYGRQCDFENFPAKENPKVKLLEGAQAYAFFLTLVNDMDNIKTWSSEASSSYKRLHESFLERFPEKEILFSKFQESVKGDTKLIRREILSQLRPHQFHDAARDVSRQTKGETALLIGTIGRSGQLSDYTISIAKALGKSRGDKVSEIIVFNPVTGMAALIKKELDMSKPHNIDNKVRITAAKWLDLPVYFELCERAFVDLPMGDDPAADAFIMKSWRERSETNNTLTHMRGQPQLRGLSTAEWKEFSDSSEHKSVILPEDIKARAFHLQDSNNKILSMANRAFTIAATIRAAEGEKKRASVRDILGTDHAFPMPKVPSAI